MGPYARYPFVFFEKVKPTVSYPIYSLLETFATCGVFPTCQQNDPHWNRAGHRIAAQALYDIARTEGVVPQNPVTNAPSARAP